MERTIVYKEACSRHNQMQSGRRPIPSARRTPTEEAKLFRKKAAEVSKTISLSSQRLKRLTTLIKRQNSVFQDPTDEINNLTGKIKYDTKTLSADLDDLELFLQHNKKQLSSSEHAEIIISNMKEQLVGEVSTFKNVLKERQTKIKNQRDRKNLYGRAQTNALGRPFQAQRTSNAGNNKERHRNNLQNPTSESLRRSEQATFNAQAFNSFTASSGEQHEARFASLDEDIELNLQPSAELLQQTDSSYLTSRVEAVTNIEKHIQELSGIFSRFSELVAQSEHTVARIDDNVNLAEERLLKGRDELLKYWNSHSGNFWLMAKVSFVMLFFLTFFIVFVL